jgi:hypothetical protein
MAMSGMMHQYGFQYGCLMLEAEYMSTNINTVTKFSIDSHVVCGQFKGLGFKPQTLTPFTQLKSLFEVWVFFFSWFQPLNESWVTIRLLHFAITKLEALTIERNFQMF